MRPLMILLVFGAVGITALTQHLILIRYCDGPHSNYKNADCGEGHVGCYYYNKLGFEAWRACAPICNDMVVESRHDRMCNGYCNTTSYNYYEVNDCKEVQEGYKPTTPTPPPTPTPTPPPTPPPTSPPTQHSPTSTRSTERPTTSEAVNRPIDLRYLGFLILLPLILTVIAAIIHRQWIKDRIRKWKRKRKASPTVSFPVEATEHDLESLPQQDLDDPQAVTMNPICVSPATDMGTEDYESRRSSTSNSGSGSQSSLVNEEHVNGEHAAPSGALVNENLVSVHDNSDLTHACSQSDPNVIEAEVHEQIVDETQSSNIDHFQQNIEDGESNAFSNGTDITPIAEECSTNDASSDSDSSETQNLFEPSELDPGSPIDFQSKNTYVKRTPRRRLNSSHDAYDNDDEDESASAFPLLGPEHAS